MKPSKRQPPDTAHRIQGVIIASVGFLICQKWLDFIGVYSKSAYRSIFFRSRFVVHHSLQECDSSFRGGPTVSQSVLSQTGSRGNIEGEEGG